MKKEKKRTASRKRTGANNGWRFCERGNKQRNEYRILDRRLRFFVQSDGQSDRCAAGCCRISSDFERALPAFRFERQNQNGKTEIQGRGLDFLGRTLGDADDPHPRRDMVSDPFLCIRGLEADLSDSRICQSF